MQSDFISCKKKMHEQNPTISPDYIPATLHEGKIWYINYYVTDPATGKLKEKRQKWNKIKNVVEKRQAAKIKIIEINRQLKSGWTPYAPKDAPKSIIGTIAALDIFLNSKSKELRSDSIRSYKSMAKTLKQWLISTKNEDLPLMNFDKLTALNFAIYIEEKDINNRTYNNYIKLYRTIFIWLKGNMYISDNPFEQISIKKNPKKSRIIIPEYTRVEIKEYLLQNNQTEYLAICLLVFGSLIRPKEISMLRKEHFNFNNQTIVLPPEITKNGNIRVSTIPNYNVELLKVCVDRTKAKQYVFGKWIKPSFDKECPRYYAKKWEKVRKELKLPMEMKLYSLRDSGIVQLLSDGVSPHEVMRLADHKDLTTTTAYLPYSSPEGSDIIKQKSRGF